MKRGRRTQQVTLKINDVGFTDATVADHFSQYLSAVGSELARTSDHCSHNFVNFLCDRVLNNVTVEQITEAELNIIKQWESFSPGRDHILLATLDIMESAILRSVCLKLALAIECNVFSMIRKPLSCNQ